MIDAVRYPVTLSLFASVKNGNAMLRNVNDQIGATWRRSVRSIGGYWMGTAAWNGPTSEMVDIFVNGLGMEIREAVGGLMTWQGFIGEMELVLNGVTYRRSLLEAANRIKVIYTKIGANLFTNGSAESAAWDAYNTPSTRERSTAWVSHGDYSCHVVANSEDDGVIIQSSITIAAYKGYDCRVTVNLISGTWKLEIYRTDTGDTLEQTEFSDTGDQVIFVHINDTNVYAGTVGVRLYCLDSAGEIYGDAGVFQSSPVRAETGWYENTDSQAEFGVIEDILLEAGLSNSAANALAAAELQKRAWPKTYPPDEIDPSSVKKDKLSITFLGYVHTMRFTHSLLSGTDDANTLIASLVGEAEFVDAGTVQANTLQYQIADVEAIRVWDQIVEIVLAGDDDGDRWECGVKADKLFYYNEASTAPIARMRNGDIISITGGPIEPWFAVPGLVAIDDLPLGPGPISGEGEDDPRNAYVEEVEFDAERYLAGKGGLVMLREVS